MSTCCSFSIHSWRFNRTQKGRKEESGQTAASHPAGHIPTDRPTTSLYRNCGTRETHLCTCRSMNVTGGAQSYRQRPFSSAQGRVRVSHNMLTYGRRLPQCRHICVCVFPHPAPTAQEPQKPPVSRRTATSTIARHRAMPQGFTFLRSTPSFLRPCSWTRALSISASCWLRWSHFWLGRKARQL